MRAIVCKAWGEPGDLLLEDVPAPPVAAGQVGIAVHAAGLNFADTLIISGKYQTKPPLPFSPGFEVAGRIAAVGDGAGDLAVGQRVMAVVDHGGFAEQVTATIERVFPLADNVDDVTAAAMPIAYGTSHLALTYRAKLSPGETLLVHGAAGGVGMTAVEIGKRLGATVIATATGEAKLAIAAAAGADHLIDSRAEDLRDQVKALTQGRGADVVYDPVGGKLFEESLRATALGGRILVVGFASGTVPQIPANILLVKNITVLGFYWGQYETLAPEHMRASLQELLAWLAKGEIRPHVSHTFPLEQAIEALTALKTRRSTGKVVLTMAG
ncbi:MAG: NADPH:quinone oxidoreductase family protein [Rhodospirillales bacterium]